MNIISAFPLNFRGEVSQGKIHSSLHLDEPTYHSFGKVPLPRPPPHSIQSKSHQSKGSAHNHVISLATRKHATIFGKGHESRAHESRKILNRGLFYHSKTIPSLAGQENSCSIGDHLCLTFLRKGAMGFGSCRGRSRQSILLHRRRASTRISDMGNAQAYGRAEILHAYCVLLGWQRRCSFDVEQRHCQALSTSIVSQGGTLLVSKVLLLYIFNFCTQLYHLTFNTD